MRGDYFRSTGPYCPLSVTSGIISRPSQLGQLMMLARPSSAGSHAPSYLRTFSILSAQDPSPTIRATNSPWAPYPTPHSHVYFPVPVRLPSTSVCLNTFTSLHRRSRLEPRGVTPSMLHSRRRQLARLCLDSHAGPLGLTCNRGALHLPATRLGSTTVESESNGSPNRCRRDPEQGAPVVRLPRT